MELLFSHKSNHCGVTDEARFVYSGPHIKQVCNNSDCGKYVKFISQALIPDVREIKLKIWSISQDVELIDFYKGVSGFADGLSGVDEKITYWRLYLEIRKGEVKND